MTSKIKVWILILAFIEGGAVMCVELCGAKILSPFFGTSIYVWASVLGVTLTALMSGYYIGGYISSKNLKKELVVWIMMIAGCLVSFTPVISKIVLPITIQLNLLMGSVISLLSFLFIPLALFGAVSPLIIGLLTTNANQSGKSSGTVYAISTLGGIISTFFIGFYTLPQFGIKTTLHGYGLLVIITSLILIIIMKVFNFNSLFLLVISFLSYRFQYESDSPEILYKSEGILGEVKVVDRSFMDPALKKPQLYRELMVNNITQTIVQKDNPDVSYWNYVNTLVNSLKHYSKGQNALLLGLGGGTLYKRLTDNNLSVDVVEIDARIEYVAKKFFDLDPLTRIEIDDARHFITTTQNNYDIIIYDLYHSETPPVHLMTHEAFSEIKDKLNEGGILAINFYGFIHGNKGKAARSIYKTLNETNYDVQLIATEGEEKDRNLLFICSKDLISGKEYPSNTVVIDKNDLDIEDAIYLTDDKPLLEHLYLKAAIAWRKNYNESNAKYFLRNN